MGSLARARFTEDTKPRGRAKRAEVGGLQARVRVSAKGRVVIPAAIRNSLGIAEGGVLELRVVDGEVRASTLRSRIQRVQERASRYVKPGTLVSDELSAERREAARHE
ncbi:MAG: AbrB/MazE/SpoVT family DNA-binding domain-containing protein [Terracidiphilus sp.]